MEDNNEHIPEQKTLKLRVRSLTDDVGSKVEKNLRVTSPQKVITFCNSRIFR